MEIPALESGAVTAIDNRRLARAAKLAGAPAAASAGLDFHVRLGAMVVAGEPLFMLHAETPGELAYALHYITAHPEIVSIGTSV